jgi:hypothetical protein
MTNSPRTEFWRMLPSVIVAIASASSVASTVPIHLALDAAR